MYEITNPPQSYSVPDYYCGEQGSNAPFAGPDPLTSEAIVTYDSDLLTSVAVTYAGDYNIMFLGTATGHLKKVRGVLVC